MNEADLLGAVIDLCRLYGVRVAHFRPARTEKGWRTPVAGDGKGWPDLVMVGARGTLWRELKGPAGRLSPEQTAWLNDLRTARQDADVWRPADWPARVDAEVRAISGRGRGAA